MGNVIVIIILIAVMFIYVSGCETYFRKNKPIVNDQTKVVVTRQGIGLCGLLFIVLFLLRVGVIDTTVMGWSWIWVTIPLWGLIALFVSILLFMCLNCLVTASIITLVAKYKKNKK